ncbi:PREDICTED: thioredoxin H7 [Tarenaya hassleriana]|uniref:thioredoxin H7 n=1 Tax=Tarenaya hassleriana TaxID=28532 RepID=UPI00053C60D3|nr:PREDICTED: thioredoxin H7 [Tarenaya hassleriana]
MYIRKRNFSAFRIFQESNDAAMGANASYVHHDVHTPMEAKRSSVTEIQSRRQWRSLFDSVKITDKLLVIDFTAAWCGPCKAMDPKVQELAAKYAEKVVFLKVDVDRLMDVAGAYNANVLPAFVFVKRGEEIDRVVGAKPDELVNKIDKHSV